MRRHPGFGAVPKPDLGWAGSLAQLFQLLGRVQGMPAHNSKVWHGSVLSICGRVEWAGSKVIGFQVIRHGPAFDILCESLAGLIGGIRHDPAVAIVRPTNYDTNSTINYCKLVFCC